MSFEVLNPTYETPSKPFSPPARLDTLAGSSVAIVSNGKQGTGRFFEAMSERLRSHHGVTSVELVVKPNYSAPAGDAILHPEPRWHAVISGIGD